MRVATLFNWLLSDKGFWVRSVRLEAGEIHVSVVSRRRVPRCGGCDRIARRVYDRKRRVWRHLAILAVRIFLEATVRRVHCRRCGVRSEQVAWARTGSLFTRDFEDQVAGLTRATDKTTVKRLFGAAPFRWAVFRLGFHPGPWSGCGAERYPPEFRRRMVELAWSRRVVGWAHGDLAAAAGPGRPSLDIQLIPRSEGTDRGRLETAGLFFCRVWH